VRSVVGHRPYIPFESSRYEFRDQSELMQTYLDTQLFHAGMFNRYNDSAKIKTVYGTSFIEPLPVLVPTIERSIQPDMYGQPTLVESQTLQLRLKLRVLAPWEVYVDPYATNLEEKDGCRFVVKLVLTSRREIIRLAEMGAYPNLDIDELRKVQGGDAQDRAKHWGFSMLSDMGIPIPENDDDIGIVQRYESDTRYIDVWNGLHVLRAIDNPFKHGLINLSRHKHTSDPHPQNAFWGIGECKPNEVLFAMTNDIWNMTLTSHMIHNQPTIYYRKNAVHPDALVRTAGNRVAIDAGHERPISDSIMDAPINALPRDHYMIPTALERMQDMTSGIYDMQRGEMPIKESTASEAAMRREAGDIRLELEIRNSEAFLADLGNKCLSHVDQFSTMADKIELLGQEGAARLMYSNPHDLPGGFNFTFKGSDRAANILIKQRNLKELTPMLLQIPNVLPGGLAQLLLETHEIPQADIRKFVIPDEIMQQIQQQQQQQQMAYEREQEERQYAHEEKVAQIKRRQTDMKRAATKNRSRGGQPGGKYKVNTTLQTAESQAREGIRT